MSRIYLDVVNVFSRNVEEHLINLKTVLSFSQNAGMKKKMSKYFFMNDSIEYLDEIFKPKELSVAPKKIDSTQNMMSPEAKSQLCSFFGL